jgi:hypothetical protein
MIVKDFKQIRTLRQTQNINTVLNTIISNQYNEFIKHINQHELKRTLETVQFTFPQFWDKCQTDHSYAHLVAIHLSKCASRQGNHDEKEQFDACIETAFKVGINIEQLSTTAWRATKHGRIISHADMKLEKITKDMCLKSFDGKISGRISGFISAKIAFGDGGHQDNVFEEQDTLAHWWINFAPENQILVLLIDTDLKAKFQTLKQKYQQHVSILIMNHVEFQEWMLNI